MAASKTSPLFSESDKQFISEQLGIEMFYCRRDANTVYVGKSRKSDSKVRFDRDRFRRMQIIAAVIEAATGIKPAEREPADLNSFMSRIGKKFEPMQEIPAQQHQPSTDDVPWDMNTPF